MATSVDQRIRSLWLAGLCLVLAACEVHPTSEALPFLEPGAGRDHGTTTVVPVTAQTTVRPVVLRAASGNVHEAIPFDALHFYVADGGLVAPGAAVAVTGATPVPVEGAVIGWSGAAIVESGLALNVVTEPVVAVEPGRRLLRVVERRGRSIREPLVAIGHDNGDLVVTCPRRAEGAVQDLDTGAWIAAIWQPASDGGCPVLRSPVLPARD